VEKEVISRLRETRRYFVASKFV